MAKTSLDSQPPANSCSKPVRHIWFFNNNTRTFTLKIFFHTHASAKSYTWTLFCNTRACRHFFSELHQMAYRTKWRRPMLRTPLFLHDSRSRMLQKTFELLSVYDYFCKFLHPKSFRKEILGYLKTSRNVTIDKVHSPNLTVMISRSTTLRQATQSQTGRWTANRSDSRSAILIKGQLIIFNLSREKGAKKWS